MELKNNSNSPLYVHIAYVTPKTDYHHEDSANYAWVKEFWRGYDTNRGLDFSDNIQALEFQNNKLNPDKFIILKHMKLKIGTAGGSNFTDPNNSNHRNIKMWIPLRRQLRFENHNFGAPIDGAIYQIVYCDSYGGSTAAVPTADVLNMAKRHICYFKEPKES